MSLRAAGASAVAAVALVAAGCGGEEGPTREQFASRANEICQRHTANIERAASELLAGGQPPSPQQFGRLARGTIVPEVRQTFQELRQVQPPEDLEQQYNRFLETGQQTVNRIERDPSMITNPANFRELNRQVDQLGLSRACRVGPD